MHAVTIAARNYLAMARTLAQSYREHNPEHGMTILVVDAEPGEVLPTQEYEIATPADLSLSDEEFGRMAFLYDVTELSTALKPWALEMLLDRGHDVAVYLDPDIFVYDSLSEIEKLSLIDGIVLTPHTSEPMPRDGLRPTEADIMGAGTFNLGFIAVSKGDRPMLEWWQARLRRDSISAPAQMLFTDQRWIDLVPGYFNHCVLRDPGYNVAYWNLNQRELTSSAGRVRVNSSPLRFFHFSGYSPDTPWILSKYVADNPRVILSEHRIAQKLCDEYAAAIRDEGFELASAIPYRFNRLRDGTPITAPMRRIYREAVIAADRTGGEYPPAPSEIDDDEAVRAWFTAPAGPNRSLNRLVFGLWESRGDLRAAFPDPCGANREALLHWCRTSGITDRQVAANLLPPEGAADDSGRGFAENNAVCGVNIAGYFQAEMGVGQIGRLLVDAVRASGLPYSTLRSTQTVSRQEAAFDDDADRVRYKINIASVNADQFPAWVHDVGPDLLRDRYTIGVWAWEVEEFPDEYAHALTLVDEIWAISSFVQKAIQAKTSKPVFVIPYQLGEASTAEPLDRARLGIPDKPYFLFMFDYLSIFERKNPLAVVAAFAQAFPAEGEATLVIKAINGERFRSQRERLRHAVSGRSDIYLIEDYLDRSLITSLSANAAAYVSLHRAEGLGLTLSESMSAGRPVIATAYSGNLDFMTPQDSLLVPYGLVDIPPTAQPYPPTAKWAEPDIAAAADAMRWVVAHPEEAAALGQRAREHTQATGNLDRTVDFISQRVRTIFSSMQEQAAARERAAASSGFTAGALARRARSLLDSPPDVNSPSRLPMIAKRVRQATYRALAHHDEHVNDRLYAMTTALEVLASETNEAIARLNFASGSQDTRTSELARRVDSIDQRAKDESVQTSSQLKRLGSAADEARSQLTGAVHRIDDLASLADRARLAIQGHDQRIDALASSSDQINATVEAHTQQFADVSERLGRQADIFARLDAEQAADPYRADPGALRLVGPDGEEFIGFDGSTEIRGTYQSFEDVYRGSEDFISSRLETYLKVVKDRAPVLDVGCGRGEFLALLRSRGTEARGIDLDESMVRRSQERGLDVELGNALTLLSGAAEEAFGAVTSFQVVEHISPELVAELFRATYRALRPGGVMIAETVNPHSPAALKTFWLDITHVRPLFPESLLFLARECGFGTARIVFPHVSGDLSTKMRHSGEYALIAHK